MKNIATLMLCIAATILSGCSKTDEEAPNPPAGGLGRGSIAITSLDAKYSAATGMTSIFVNVQASGISGDEIKTIGAVCSTNQNVTTGAKGYLYGGKTSGQIKISSGTISRKTKYYVKASLSTGNGTVYSSVKSITTP